MYEKFSNVQEKTLERRFNLDAEVIRVYVIFSVKYIGKYNGKVLKYWYYYIFYYYFPI